MKSTIYSVITLIGLFTMINVKISAQDFFFHQPFSNPLNLNPAYAGSLGCSRLAMNYRNDLTTFSDVNFSTTNVSYDQFVPKLSSGFGVQYMNSCFFDLEKVNYLNFAYTYNYKISKNFVMRPAVNFGVGQINYDYNIFRFVQGDTLYYIGNKEYINFGTGILIAYKNLIAGFSYDHINKPNIDLFEEYKISSKFTFHANLPFEINKNTILNPGFIYQNNRYFSSYTPSLLLKYKYLKCGISYRNFVEGADDISLMAGFVNKSFSIGYSFNYTLSKLKAINSDHEISLIYKFNCKNGRGDSRLSKLGEF